MIRVVLLLIGMCTHWYSEAGIASFWAVMGFLFVPWTSFIYILAKLNGGVTDFWTILMVIAIICDFLRFVGGFFEDEDEK